MQKSGNMEVVSSDADFQSVACRPPASEEGGMVALSQMATFLAVEKKKIMGTS